MFYIQAVFLELASGLHMRKSMARNSEAVTAFALWEGGRMMHCNKGPVITHTHSAILISINGLD
jgi:hypothetical protein